MEWKKITKNDIGKRMILVTNNMDARTRLGEMSHIWIINELCKSDKVGYTGNPSGCYGMNPCGLTHYMEIKPVIKKTKRD